MEKLTSLIREIPDFPRPGILFKDITPLLEDADAFHFAVTEMATRAKGLRPTKIVSIESRGFIFGAPLAYELHCGLVIVRKPNKLPHKTTKIEYALEYGVDRLEMHVNSLQKGDRVIIVDDLLATGGTAAATAELVSRTGASVEALLFLCELPALHGRQKLKDYDVVSLVSF